MLCRAVTRSIRSEPAVASFRGPLLKPFDTFMSSFLNLVKPQPLQPGFDQPDWEGIHKSKGLQKEQLSEPRDLGCLPTTGGGFGYWFQI